MSEGIHRDKGALEDARQKAARERRWPEIGCKSEGSQREIGCDPERGCKSEGSQKEREDANHKGSRQSMQVIRGPERADASHKGSRERMQERRELERDGSQREKGAREKMMEV